MVTTDERLQPTAGLSIPLIAAASDWWIPLISAGAALAGVALNDFLQRRREREGRQRDLERETFIQLDAWQRQANDVVEILLKQVSGALWGKTDLGPRPQVPQPSYEFLARTYLYLNAELANNAASAAAAVRKFSASEAREPEQALDYLGEASEALGRLQAHIDILHDHAEASWITRFGRRVLRRPMIERAPPRIYRR